MTQDEDFLDVIENEMKSDPQNLALREDYIILLLQKNPDRAARELTEFEAVGGDPARVRLLRARLMAARVRGNSTAGPSEPSTPPPPPEPVTAERPMTSPAPPPSTEGDGDASSTSGLWDTERPVITLASVAGLSEVKQHLDSTFLAPLRNPELAAAFGQKPGGSLLMYGPPGCGKTFIAKAIAGDLGASFIHVTLADLLSKWPGDSEKAIQSVFRDARATAPGVVFFDEFDALGARRTSGGGSHATRTIVTRLLEELDGVTSHNEGVYFLAATNRPWDIDPALRRPGRIDKTVLVPPPDALARAAILHGELEGRPAEVDVAAVARATEGFSGADIVHVAKAALQQSLMASMEAAQVIPVTTDSLLATAAAITPSPTSWFDQIAPMLEYGVDDGTFAQLRSYRVRCGLR